MAWAASLGGSAASRGASAGGLTGTHLGDSSSHVRSSGGLRVGRFYCLNC